MKIHPASKKRLLVDMTLDVDPTGSTVEINVDGTWYDAEWLDDPVHHVADPHWTQTARTIDKFAGPDAPPGGATVLALGRHKSSTRVTLTDGDALVATSSSIDVRT